MTTRKQVRVCGANWPVDGRPTFRARRQVDERRRRRRRRCVTALNRHKNTRRLLAKVCSSSTLLSSSQRLNGSICARFCCTSIARRFSRVHCFTRTRAQECGCRKKCLKNNLRYLLWPHALIATVAAAAAVAYCARVHKRRTNARLSAHNHFTPNKMIAVLMSMRCRLLQSQLVSRVAFVVAHCAQ